MSRDKPVLRAIKHFSLIERNANGLRVADMAEQLGAPSRAVYRDLDVLQQLEVPLYTDKNGRESLWKLDPDYRSRLSIPFHSIRTPVSYLCPRFHSTVGGNRDSVRFFASP